MQPKQNAYMSGCVLKTLPILAGLTLSLTSCSIFQVTPAERAMAYTDEATVAGAECAAYKFDRAAGLVPEVPAMSKLCE